MTDTPPPETSSPEDPLTWSGLDLMTAILEGRHPRATMSGPIGFALSAVADGRVAFRGTPTADHLNPLGTVHGGWYGTLLDSAMTCAVSTRLPAGQAATTLEFKTGIVRAIPVGTEVEAVGIADHVGRSIGVARGELRGVADGRLYATGSTTCLVLRLPATPPPSGPSPLPASPRRGPA